MMWNYGGDGWTWLWMSGMMLLFWGGVIAIAIWAIRAFSSPRRGGDSSIEILRRRLAAGEITADEFERTKKALGA